MIRLLLENGPICVIEQTDDIFNARVCGGYASGYKDKYIGIKLTTLLIHIKNIPEIAQLGMMIGMGTEFYDSMDNISPTSLMKIYRITRR